MDLPRGEESNHAPLRRVFTPCVPQNPIAIVGTPTTSLIAQFALPGPEGRTLLVATVRAINRAPEVAFNAQIDRLVIAMQDHVGSILLAGDFNTQR